MSFRIFKNENGYFTGFLVCENVFFIYSLSNVSDAEWMNDTGHFIMRKRINSTIYEPKSLIISTRNA